jgi:hypothetical protein
MKKSMVLVLALFLFAGSVSAANGKFILNLYGTMLDLPQNSLTGQESQYKVFLEAKAAVAISGNIYLWASHGYFPLRDGWAGWESKNSFEKDISVERTLAKRIIAGGCGIYVGYFEPSQFGLRAEAGVCSIANDITNTVSAVGTGKLIRTEEARQSGIGFRANLAVTYGIYKSVFAEVTGGYLYAADTVDGERTRLGGFHLAAGLGIQL